MGLEVADPLLSESKDGKYTKRRPLDMVDGLPCYSEEGLRKNNIQGESPPGEQKGWVKRYLLPCLNMFTFVIAAPVSLQAAYSGKPGEHWYANVLLFGALICYAFGTVLGIGLKFVEGTFLSTFFPKSCSARKLSYEEFQDVGAAGFWHKWFLVLCTCLYVELTSSIVGSLVGISDSLAQRFPVFRSFTVSWLSLEPSSLLIVLFISVMILPMRHNTMFDLTWFGLGPLYFANSFPVGFPVYRVFVGMFSNYSQLLGSHKEHIQAKAATLKYFSS